MTNYGEYSLSGELLASLTPRLVTKARTQKHIDYSCWLVLFSEILTISRGYSPTDSLSWRGTWRSTVASLGSTNPQIDCRQLYSDHLYRPFQCSQIDLSPFTQNIPQSNRIPRLEDLSLERFTSSWADQPFILTAPVKEWPCFREWEFDNFLGQYGDVVFRAEAVDWPLRNYIEYMNDNMDESPLYLFDCDFVRKMALQIGRNVGVYWPPECFGDDLFELLEGHRPDSRWLIVGPKRSGSTFHKDPNATSAWNAVIRGSKYWIMFPSSVDAPSPPGVYMSQDQSEVTSPLSIAEWMMTYHAEAQKTPGCKEGVCSEGEVLHVPSGWWHLVVNIEPSIAITQNFIPKAHLGAALDFLENKKDQVTGFKKDVPSPHALFVEKLKQHVPELLKPQPKINGAKRKWQHLVNGEGSNHKTNATFSFGLGSEASDEDIP